jgi:hypothetical protein
MRSFRKIGWIMPVLLPLLCRCAPAEQPWNTRLVGQIGGACWAVQVVGNYAYIGEGQNLTILDVSNPSSPVAIARLFLSDMFVRDIYVNAGLAYVAGLAGGLRIVDISDPRSPRLRGTYQTQLWAFGVFVTGGLAYIANIVPGGSWEGELQIVDVSNPSSPVFRGSFHTYRWARKVVARNSVAYLATGSGGGGLYILDVTDPSSPTRLSFYNGECSDVFLVANLAYVAIEGGLDIVDVTSPSAPTRRSVIGTGGGAGGIFVSGGFAYMAQASGWPDYPNVFVTVDVTNPTSPTVRASLSMRANGEAVVVSGGLAYVANWEAGLTIVDVTNPSSPTVRGSYESLSNPTDVCVANGVAYVANGVKGFKTIDVSNPQSPAILGFLATGGSIENNGSVAGRIHLLGKTLYLADGANGLRVIDVTTPSLPRLQCTYDTPGRAEDVFVSGGLAYIADHASGLRIADVTNPTSPTTRGACGTPDGSRGVAVSNGLAYMADTGSGLQIVDVRNPASPAFRSSYNDALLGNVNNVFLSNGIAYITSIWDYVTLEAIDVTNPAAPWRRSSYSADAAYFYFSNSGGVFVSGDFCYAVVDGLRIFDIRNPSAPVLRGYYPPIESQTAALYSSVFVSGDLIYLTDLWHGLYILQFTAPLAAKHWNLYR